MKQEYFLERYGLKELADVHMRNFVTSVVFFSKTDGSGGSGVTRAVTFARLVGMWEHAHSLITLWLCVMSNTLLTWAPRLNAFGPAELEWFFSCRQDLFSHVDQLCCFDLDDSATKVTLTRAIDHARRMFVTLQVWWVFFSNNQNTCRPIHYVDRCRLKGQCVSWRR